MKESLTDLNSLLFQDLERLGNESLEGDKLAEAIERSKAIGNVAEKIITNGTLVLKAQIVKHKYDYASDYKDNQMPTMLTGGSDNEEK